MAFPHERAITFQWTRTHNSRWRHRRKLICAGHLHVKAQRDNMRALKLAALSVVVLVLSTTVWIVWEFSQPSEAKQRFIRTEWLARESLATGIGDPGCVRGGMALDLIDRELLLGMRTAEVLALLGSTSRQDSDWCYALGQCSGLGWYDSELIVRFDTSNRVASVSFHRVPGYAP